MFHSFYIMYENTFVGLVTGTASLHSSVLLVNLHVVHVE